MTAHTDRWVDPAIRDSELESVLDAALAQLELPPPAEAIALDDPRVAGELEWAGSRYARLFWGD